MYCDNQDIVATFCDKFAQVWASCQLSPHLLEKILSEVAIGSKETLIGQTDIFSGIALLGQFDRTQVISCLGEAFILMRKRLVDGCVSSESIIKGIVKGGGHRLLSSIVVNCHLIKSLELLETVENEINNVLSQLRL